MELTTPTEVTVDRSKWVCGEYRNHKNELVLGDSKLKNVNGKKCCLGFGCVACGIPESKLNNLEMPGVLATKVLGHSIPLFTKEHDPIIGYQNSDFSKAASPINDDEKITQGERETKLTSLFKNHGVTLKFVGEFAKDVAKIIASEDAEIKRKRGW